VGKAKIPKKGSKNRVFGGPSMDFIVKPLFLTLFFSALSGWGPSQGRGEAQNPPRRAQKMVKNRGFTMKSILGPKMSKKRVKL